MTVKSMRRSYPKTHLPPQPGARRIDKPEVNVRFQRPEQYAEVKRVAHDRGISINQFIIEAAMAAVTKAQRKSSHDQAA